MSTVTRIEMAAGALVQRSRAAVRRLGGVEPGTCVVPIGQLYDLLHDDVTGLLRCDTWSHRATRVVADGHARAVLLADVDYLKAWNDQHGHGVGNLVLSRLGAILAAELRAADVVGRYGGDELVALLHGGDEGRAAEAVAGRLRARVAAVDLGARTILRPDGRRCGLTVSIGAAICTGPTTDLATLLAAADDAAYVVKRSGRDGVRVIQVDGAQPRSTVVGAGHAC